MRIALIAGTAVLLVAPLSIARAAGAGDEAVARCKSLERSDFRSVPEAPTQVTRATRIAGPDGTALCQVAAYALPQVGFEIRLPEGSWNGKLIHMGSGGHGGSVSGESCSEPVRRGYACLVTDMGHKGGAAEAGWASGNLQAKLDFGYRATHVATVAGKAIAVSYYGRDIEHSYFSGCSTGGRQALQAAQRFPWDFDGIIAGAPPIRLSELYVAFAWGMHVSGTASGNPVLTVADLELLSRGALAKCDMDDGVRDGIISRPLSCSFQPSELACAGGQRSGCLGAAQIEASQQMYAGPVDARGHSLVGGGVLPGSEFGNWERYYLETNGQKSYLYGLTEDGFRHLFSSPERGAGWSLRDFDFERDPRRLDVMQGLYDSSNPDLGRFQAAGGKLLIYMGMNDISIPRTAIDYYEKVERVAGGRQQAQEFVRLFTLPGVEHCRGGPGADLVDYLGALERWVEQGQPPDRLLAYHMKSGRDAAAVRFPPPAEAVQFSRPVYPYPTYARYSGRGDPNDAASFRPASPRGESRRP